MKSTVYLLFFLFAFTTLTSCKKSSATITFPTNLIGVGSLEGNGQEGFSKQNIVVYNSATWNDLVTKMNSVNNVSDEFTETNIDFNTYSVIAVFDRVQGSSGYSVQITGVFDNSSNVIVKLNYSQSVGNVLPVMTQPFHIVKVAALDKKKSVIFE